MSDEIVCPSCKGRTPYEPGVCHCMACGAYLSATDTTTLLGDSHKPEWKKVMEEHRAHQSRFHWDKAMDQCPIIAPVIVLILALMCLFVIHAYVATHLETPPFRFGGF